MKIIIAGGTGQVGAVLARAFAADHHDVAILTRGGSRPQQDGIARRVAWDGKSLGAWTDEIDGADVLINLAGRSVNCRYHQRNRWAMSVSRIESTRVIGQAIAQAQNPPPVWLQMSTATIYAHRYDAPNDEVDGILGGGSAEQGAPSAWQFSIELAKAWEQACRDAETPHTRKVLMRSAMVMSPDRGGVFDVLLRLVRFGLGGRQGDGRQFVSWIHEADFVRAVQWLMAHDDLSGPVNLASPNPLPNAQFMEALRKAWGARMGLPAARWMLEIGAFFLRTETELILKSRRVVPGRLLDAGFQFRQPNWPEAASELVERWREYNATNARCRSPSKEFIHGPA